MLGNKANQFDKAGWEKLGDAAKQVMDDETRKTLVAIAERVQSVFGSPLTLGQALKALATAYNATAGNADKSFKAAISALTPEQKVAILSMLTGNGENSADVARQRVKERHAERVGV